MAQQSEVTLVNVKEWATSVGLTEESYKKLMDTECADFRVLQYMSDSMIDAMGLSLGQGILLKIGVKGIRQEAFTNQDTTQTQTDSAADKQGGLSYSQLLQQDTTNQTTHLHRIDQDPSVFLRMKEGEKPLDIVDYVKASITVKSQQILASDNGSRILIEAGPRRPRLESVTMEQWGSANMRIMFSLMETGALSEGGIQNYMAYTVKVFEFAERFEWISVLLYDREYRHLQASYKFPWGSDSQHLSTVMLRNKAPVPKPRNIAAPGSQPMRRPSSDDPCLQFNMPAGCQFGVRCRYRHVCLVCSEPHPRHQHSNSREAKNVIPPRT